MQRAYALELVRYLRKPTMLEEFLAAMWGRVSMIYLSTEALFAIRFEFL
jgi:hypothetical protein